MLEILQLYWLSIVKYCAIVFGLLLIYFKGRQDNNTAQERKQAMETLKAIQTRDKVENNISNLTNDKLNKLYDKQIKRD